MWFAKRYGQYFNLNKEGDYHDEDPTDEAFLPLNKSDKGSPRPQSRRATSFDIHYIVPWMFSGLCFMAVIYMSAFGKQSVPCECAFKDTVYSPAQDAVEMHNIVFTTGLKNDPSIYQGPSTPERDKAWDALYGFGISRIPKWQAAKLVNKTVPIPGDDGYYITELNVFHNLHCLNLIRKRLWIAEPIDPDDEIFGFDHISHCIDAIRQSLMCSADITPISNVWDSKHHKAFVHFDVMHTCRNFEKIRQWGAEHKLKPEGFNRTIYVEDDLQKSP